MFTKLYESLRVYVNSLEIAKAKLNVWKSFYITHSIHLQTIIGQCNNNLVYHEITDNGNVIEFGATCKIIPIRCFVLEGDVETIKDKMPARLRIQQNHKGDVIFVANRSYFDIKVPEIENMLLREPIDPSHFDYNELPNIIAEFLDQVIEWEKLN